MKFQIFKHLTFVFLTAIFLNSVSFLDVNAAQDRVQAKQTASKKDTRTAYLKAICSQIETAAKKWELPPGFLARLIWKESRFDAGAVSPKGASGIAQFMPGTADLRGLENPFDPSQAIPASAHFLADLRRQFGNLGLAAAAYNAGPRRVSNWLQGKGRLPAETRDYVFSITGHAAVEWDQEVEPKTDYRLDKQKGFLEACRTLPVTRVAALSSLRSAPWQPWGVHLTSNWRRSDAMATYRRIQKKFKNLLGGVDPIVLRTRRHAYGGNAARFHIRIGKPNRKQALELCHKLRKQGGFCIVEKNQR